MDNGTQTLEWSHPPIADGTPPAEGAVAVPGLSSLHMMSLLKDVIIYI